MASGLIVCALGLMVGVVGIGLVAGQVDGHVASRSCWFPAIYNFGDSNSDTGGRSASALSLLPSPYGETFFGKPSGRFCDGRLIIDFIADNMGLPYLSAYLDSIGTNFSHGANFASGGSSILRPGFSPVHLDIQISQFIQFKTRTTALYNQLRNNGKIPPCKSNLPRPEDFSAALYTFDIGQNDLSYGFQNGTTEEVRASIPNIIDKFSIAIQQLYKEGARVFWVHNTGPLGCLPRSVIYGLSKHEILDQNGCVKLLNEVSKEFNKQLKDRVSQLRIQLLQAAITYVDVYSAKHLLIMNAKGLGFAHPMNFCCGTVELECGNKVTVNGTVFGNPCDDPSKHISWDGTHYSEAANKLVAKAIVNGSMSDPPVSVAHACHDNN